MDPSPEANLASRNTTPHNPSPRDQSGTQARPIGIDQLEHGGSGSGSVQYRRAGSTRHNDWSNVGDAASSNEETWQDFLRRAPPQDIINRDPSDPIRQAYVLNRRVQAIEEARKRRRAATTSSSHRPPPPPPQLARQNSTGSANRYQQGPFQYSRLPPLHSSSMSTSRPLPRLPSLDSRSTPEWQPDSEVDACPICERSFSMFKRRHHCRKCGRVVCASCSPHRITIPRQFIVHPPEFSNKGESSRSTASKDGREVVDLTGEDDGGSEEARQSHEDNQEINPALGGGQEVRLCNPCVPDPNPHPSTYTYGDAGRNTLASFPSPRDSTQAEFASSRHTQRPVSMFVDGSDSGSRTSWPDHPGRAQAFQRSHGTAASPVSPQNFRSPYGSAPAGHDAFFQGNPNWNVPRPGPHGYRHRHHASAGVLPTRPQAIRTGGPLPPTPPPPPPPIREEDECPICLHELPPKGPDGSETAREAHVEECIASRFSSSAPRPPPEVAIEAAVAANRITPSQARGNESSTASTGAGSPSQATVAESSSAPRARRRTTGIVVYNATEKDCIGGDEQQQECVICFEDFEVGAEMGRLECLCKFHKMCIRQWWERKGPGSCPVHQDGI